MIYYIKVSCAYVHFTYGIIQSLKIINFENIWNLIGEKQY